MHIQLQGIRPAYLENSTIRESEIWDLDIHFENPDFVIVWGPSGRGKSTLLRILYGLENRYSGSLMLDECAPKGPRHVSWPRIRSERLAFLSQDFRLFEESSGWENLRMLPLWAPGVDEEKLLHWAESIGIDAILDRPPHTWSQGQRQRFSLIRCLASPFEWLLLDEPVSHLDPESAQRSLKLMLSVCEERAAGWILAQQTPETHIPTKQILRI